MHNSQLSCRWQASHCCSEDGEVGVIHTWSKSSSETQERRLDLERVGAVLLAEGAATVQLIVPAEPAQPAGSSAKCALTNSASSSSSSCPTDMPHMCSAARWRPQSRDRRLRRTSHPRAQSAQRPHILFPSPPLHRPGPVPLLKASSSVKGGGVT